MAICWCLSMNDNVLAPDFLEQAVGLLEDRPYLGVFGAGVVELEFEALPPAVDAATPSRSAGCRARAKLP